MPQIKTCEVELHGGACDGLRCTIEGRLPMSLYFGHESDSQFWRLRYAQTARGRKVRRYQYVSRTPVEENVNRRPA